MFWKVVHNGYGLGGMYGSPFWKVVSIRKSIAMSAAETLLKSGADALRDLSAEDILCVLSTIEARNELNKLAVM